MIIVNGQDDQFAKIQDRLSVKSLPYVIVFQNGSPAFLEEPSSETLEKLLNLKNSEQENTEEEKPVAEEVHEEAMEQIEASEEEETQEGEVEAAEEDSTEIEAEAKIEEPENRQPGPQTMFQTPQPHQNSPPIRAQPQQMMVRDPRTG